METTFCFIDGWTDKGNVYIQYLYWIYIYHTHTLTMKCYSAVKKEWSIAICDNMDELWGQILSEMSQAEKDKYCMISLTYGI